ncbi:MAG: cytochrome c [Chloroflexi bacterium]|nr:cytochrome c [Chloroflexota bacterium]
MCHGHEGRGDGPVVAYFQAAGAPVPVDLAGAQVRALTEGQLYWILSNALGFMPPYSRLVNSEERWLLVHYIQSIAGR